MSSNWTQTDSRVVTSTVPVVSPEYIFKMFVNNHRVFNVSHYELNPWRNWVFGISL